MKADINSRDVNIVQSTDSLTKIYGWNSSLQYRGHWEWDIKFVFAGSTQYCRNLGNLMDWLVSDANTLNMYSIGENVKFELGEFWRENELYWKIKVHMWVQYVEILKRMHACQRGRERYCRLYFLVTRILRNPNKNGGCWIYVLYFYFTRLVH